MSDDLYGDLGVERDASEADIRKAYRRRAKKAHPDAGGSREDFDRIHRALTVLTDPKRRGEYDRTGTIDDSVDTEMSETLECLVALLGVVIDDETLGPHPTQKPLRTMIFKEIAKNRAPGVDKLNECKAKRKKWESVLGRWKPKGDKGAASVATVEKLVIGHMREIDEVIAKVEYKLKLLKNCEDIIEGTSYHFDPPPPPETGPVPFGKVLRGADLDRIFGQGGRT